MHNVLVCVNVVYYFLAARCLLAGGLIITGNMFHNVCRF